MIQKYTDPAVTLRTHFKRIIKRAGLKAWPRLFHNLRATRQTELAERWPAHLVGAWLGNSVAVATEHYLQVRDADYEKAAQNPAQLVSEGIGKDRQACRISRKFRAIPMPADKCRLAN